MANTSQAKNKPVVQPFLGLFYDRPSHQIDPRGFQDCNNVRIFQGRVTSALMGWTLFLPSALNGPVTLIDSFVLSTGTIFTILGTPTDLYNYNNGTPVFITPSYVTGTVSITNNTAALTGTGTAWNTVIATGLRKNARAGDQVYIGSASQNNPSPGGQGWFTIQSVNSDTSITLTTNFTGGNQTNVAYTLRQLFSGDASSFHYASETFPNAGAPDNSDLWFATNGGGTTANDPLVKWNGSSTFASLVSTVPFLCFELRRFKNMLCYGGLTQLSTGQALPTSVANSDNGLPTSYNTGVAGQYIVTDSIIQINWLGILGNLMMVYSGNQLTGDVVSAYFVGPPTNFVFTSVVRGRGPIGSRFVAEFPDRHQFIASDGEYRYNGLFIQLMNTQVWRQILQSFDYSRRDRAFNIVNRFWGDLIWAVPQTTDPGLPPNVAWVEHYLEQANNYLFKPVTKRDFPFTVSGTIINQTVLTFNNMPNGFNTYNQQFSQSSGAAGFPIQLCGDVNGFVYSLYSADTQNGTAYTSFAAFPQRLTVNERSRGVVARVYPFAEAIQSGSYNLSVALTMRDQVGGQPTFTDTQSINLMFTGNRFSSHFRAGRTGQVTFSTPGPNQPWTLDGYDWDVVQGGVR